MSGSTSADDHKQNDDTAVDTAPTQALPSQCSPELQTVPLSPDRRDLSSQRHDVDSVTSRSPSPHRRRIPRRHSSSIESECQRRIDQRYAITATDHAPEESELIDFAQWQRHFRDTAVKCAISLKSVWITLYSPYLLKIVRPPIKNSTHVIIGEDFIDIIKPYAALFWHWDEIKQATIEEPPTDSQQETDFAALELFVQTRVHRDHDRIRQTVNANSIAYEDLWALYPPTKLLFSTDHFDQPQLYCVSEFRYASNTLPNGRNELHCVVEVWHVSWDNSFRVFRSISKAIRIPYFQGQRTITSLPVYPLDLYYRFTEAPIPDLESALEERGKEWGEIVTKPPSSYTHDGVIQISRWSPNQAYRGVHDELPSSLTPSLTRLPMASHNGRLIVDQYLTRPDEVTQQVVPGGTINIDPSVHDESSADGRPATSTELSSFQAKFCPSFLGGFSLEKGKWATVLLKDLKEPTWNMNAMIHLVLDDRIKRRLQGVVTQHNKNKEKSMGDVIDKKGRGLVVVLHGLPGLGKTLTAEAVAEHTHKPLYQIGVGNTNHIDYSERIERQFTWAARWDAVLLIDEADVVLEARSWENMQRNSVVSAFLRSLEYFEGILFLTSNRLRTMDRAFQSRIHIAIQYPDLTPESRRQIWKNFIDRIPDWESKGKKELTSHLDDMETWKLNGRQIRNVLMIAQSVALSQERRKGALTYDHVEDAVNATLEFQDYFEEDSRERKAQLDEIPSRRLREY